MAYAFGRKASLRHAAFALSLAGALTAAQAAQDGMEHSQHQDMDAATMDALREAIPQLAGMSDDELMALMRMMPPDYEVFVSDKALRGDIGILVVTHGFGEEGDRIFTESLEGVAADYPTAIGYGMTMMSSNHLQSAVDDLVASGARKIVVVPAAQSEFDTGIRQWQYVFGKREEPAYIAMTRVTSEAEIVVAPTMMDHPLVSQILLDHAREISKDEPREEVVIVGHGPAGNEDNTLELEMMKGHVGFLEANSYFADVHAINLQDDSGPDIRSANVAKLRSLVEEAGTRGHKVLIVGFLIGTAGIQPKIDKDLEGLDFTFNAKGMSEHPNFIAWVRQTVDEAAEQ